MPREGMPSGFVETIRPYLKDCLGVVVATSAPCIDIQAREIDRITGRDFRATTPDALDELDLPDSWVAGILLCPGDGTRDVAAWAGELSMEALDRVRFYHVAEVDLVAALADWYDRGLPDPRTSEIRDWASFHHEFGWNHANQLYADLQRHPGWFT